MNDLYKIDCVVIQVNNVKKNHCNENSLVSIELSYST